ncbi:MAG: adenylyltransferase/cytidyltransferase family protein [Candidatus Andersenbacteria bacterium]
MTRVIVFGAFDPLHEGHKDLLRQAKALGDYLIVVVAHDSAIRASKHREPRTSEEQRIAAVKAVTYVDEVMLGRKTANRYHLLGEVEFDILAMGYNQEPTEDEVRKELEQKEKHRVKIVRLQPYKPELFSPD